MSATSTRSATISASRPPRPIRRAVLGVAAAALCVALPACSLSHGPNFQIELRRVALDLAFKDESQVKAPSPQQVLAPQPVPAIAGLVTQITPTQVPVAGEPAPPVLPHGPIVNCPTAPADAHPDAPATVFITDAPKPGTYLTHDTGTFTLGGAVSLTANYPPLSVFEVKNIQTSQASDPVNGPSNIITYDVVTHGVDGGTTTTTYRTVNMPSSVQGQVVQTATVGHEPQGELDLVKLVTVNAEGRTEFTPSPPVEMMAFKNGQGTSWTSAGIDQATGTSMVVQGSITQRKVVDVCGKVYDTYEVSSTEKITNLQTGLSSQTNPNDPNIYDYATQYGGIILHEHIDTQTTYPGSGGSAVILTVNYDQTLNSLTPGT